MYAQEDYLNYDDLNRIEQRIYELTNELLDKTDIPSFIPKTWFVNEFPYIQEVDRIEKAIDNLGYYYYKPQNWEITKIWIPKGNTQEIKKGFSYQDINRWLFNMNLIDEIKDDNSTIWNGQSFVYWDSNDTLDWE